MFIFVGLSLYLFEMPSRERVCEVYTASMYAIYVLLALQDLLKTYPPDINLGCIITNTDTHKKFETVLRTKYRLEWDEVFSALNAIISLGRGDGTSTIAQAVDSVTYDLANNPVPTD